jgi:hypothetical protein
MQYLSSSLTLDIVPQRLTDRQQTLTQKRHADCGEAVNFGVFGVEIAATIRGSAYQKKHRKNMAKKIVNFVADSR